MSELKELEIKKADGMYGEQNVSLKFLRLSDDDIILTQKWESGDMKSEVNSIIHQVDLISMYYILNHIDADKVNAEKLDDLLCDDYSGDVNISLFNNDINVVINNDNYDYISITSVIRLDGVTCNSRSYVRREVLNTFRFITQFMTLKEWIDLGLLV